MPGPLHFHLVGAYVGRILKSERSPAKDGGTLRTIREACDYMTAMGKEPEMRQQWQRAAKLILSKADVLTVSRALGLALLYDAKLDVSNFPV